MLVLAVAVEQALQGQMVQVMDHQEEVNSVEMVEMVYQLQLQVQQSLEVVAVVEQHKVIQEDTDLVVLVVVELEVLALLQVILEQ